MSSGSLNLTKPKLLSLGVGFRLEPQSLGLGLV